MIERGQQLAKQMKHLRYDVVVRCVVEMMVDVVLQKPQQLESKNNKKKNLELKGP